ncbi:MAG: precorrin-4 C(11)-methyltransferase [Clostridiales bacterium]|nr:precorrin-4 C(11)-methyltransferase [Clostridiales bacterium]
MINFVGAGPGATDLITVRGMRLLQSADVIIYAGSLVNKELLSYASEECIIYDSANMTLEEIIAVMVESDKKGLKVVRLQTGDPSIYGAIYEQMRELDKAGIEYSLCPGVSSMFGACAALKAELTPPEVSQSVIITRAEGRTPVPKSESLSSLASHKTTMVIFLSAGMTEKVSAELIKGGYDADTPAALVYKATWEDEKIVCTTVGELSESAKENEINKTALIIVGNFLKDIGSRSKLYDPTFTHEFRKSFFGG